MSAQYLFWYGKWGLKFAGWDKGDGQASWGMVYDAGPSRTKLAEHALTPGCREPPRWLADDACYGIPFTDRLPTHLDAGS